MKAKYIRELAFVFILTSALSCNKKFLDIQPLGEYSDPVVWSDPNLIETFVNTMYFENFGMMGFANRKISDFCDESRSTWSTTYNFNQSLVSQDGLQEWEDGFGAEATRVLRWDPLYANVRRENIFFSKINDVPALTPADEEKITRLKGEAYFNRGLTYHWLTALYGGVPIIDRAYGLNDSFSIARNSYEDCINFIVGQLDSAALYLPTSYTGELQGHATKGAALALKSRVLLYAASDLHNPGKNSALTAGYSTPELVGYAGGDATARWQAAKDAAKAVMDLGIYSLNMENPSPTDNVAQGFINYFTSQGNAEDILLQFVTPALDAVGARGQRISDPSGYNCWGNQTPLQELVDDFEMSDGTKFDWSDSYDKTHPFDNREPRFYATVLYDGKKYRPRPPEYGPIDPFDRIQTGRVFSTSGALLVAGIDTRDGTVNTSNAGYTGYYHRKGTDTTLDAQFILQNVPFRHFRYAETILNYAEASAELGQDGEAATYLNKIRHRAGLPDVDGTVTGTQLKDAIRHERRIEMVYENQRFWDIRRWMIADEVTHQTHSIDIRYISDQNTNTYFKPDGSTWSEPQYSVIETAGDSRIWSPKDYFFPIMRAEINKNNKLIQNPNY